MLALWLLAAVAHAGTVTYVYTDPQGTPLAEADANGNITARFEYTPYGVSVLSMGAAPNGVGYTGHVNDPETGLVYMQARYYDAEVGRFLSVDPVGAREGAIFLFNRYNYAENNPIKNVDPDGKAPQLPILAQLTYARNYIHNA
jgi:RHS repeat-associated protein